MTISAFELFKIGIGPSSSHTVGPMKAAYMFLEFLKAEGLFEQAASIDIELYGSLALTGMGHGTDKAIILGLEGEKPETVDPESVEPTLEKVKEEGKIHLLKEKKVPFSESNLLFLKDKRLPFHSNAMRFIVKDSEKNEVIKKVYYSIGGGFVVDHETAREDKLSPESTPLPYPFVTCEELKHHCKATGLSIEEIVMENERVWRNDAEIKKGMLHIWEVMNASIERGCRIEGVLPGGLKVKRRAKKLQDELERRRKEGRQDPAEVMDWVSLWALAVNEENAAGGRVVTAPTNGAAGVIPSVIKYYATLCKGDDAGVVRFLLVAAAVGILYKEGASISAAEMGCQGEIGVACSMAAAGLTAALGGSLSQIENAAEIGMEHNLGLTCDPVAGLVQIPCIERNTMGAVKAINASRLALIGDGSYKVSLDQVINTMRQTGKDMMTIYKETSQGGLAVNVPEC